MWSGKSNSATAIFGTFTEPSTTVRGGGTIIVVGGPKGFGDEIEYEGLILRFQGLFGKFRRFEPPPPHSSLL